MDPVTPTNVIGAALLMQVLLLIILFIAAFILRHEYHHAWMEQGYAWVILFLSLLSASILCLSVELAQLWKPLLGGLSLPAIDYQTAVKSVLLADIFAIGYLIVVSGGSYASPFSPALVVLPALAIFLREPPPRVVLYAGIVAGLLLLGLSDRWYMQAHPSARAMTAYYLVAVSALFLTTIVGLVTRPL